MEAARPADMTRLPDEPPCVDASSPDKRRWNGVKPPWLSVGERLALVLFRPSFRSDDDDEVRDQNDRPVESESILTNLAAALLNLLFAPLMVFVGLYKLFSGHPFDGVVTTLFGPLVSVGAGLKDLFFDVPRHVYRALKKPEPPGELSPWPETPTPVDTHNQVSEAVLPSRLTPSSGSKLGERYEARLSELTGVGPSYSPPVRFLRDGKEALDARLEAIANAKHSIYMTTYALEADAMTSAVLDALIARARAGVHVMVKTDAFTSMYIQGENSHADNEHLFAQLRELEKAGGVVTFYGTTRDMVQNLGAGDHLKMLLTDGKEAIAGGRNMSSDYFTSWKDMDGVFGGTVATHLARKSLEIARQSDPTVLSEPDGQRRKILQRRASRCLEEIMMDVERAEQAASREGPRYWAMAWNPTYEYRIHSEDENLNPISQALIETFRRARTEIIVSSNYVNGNEHVMQALLEAAKRGVRVHIVTSSYAISDRSPLPYYAAERNFQKFIDAGAHIWETYRTDHAKMYVVDGEVAAFGSYNLEHAADNHLAEQLVFSKDPAYVQRVRSELVEDIRTICKPYAGPQKLGFFPSIKRWFQKELGVLTEGYF